MWKEQRRTEVENLVHETYPVCSLLSASCPNYYGGQNSLLLGVSLKPEGNSTLETHLKLNASSQRHIRLIGSSRNSSESSSGGLIRGSASFEACALGLWVVVVTCEMVKSTSNNLIILMVHLHLDVKSVFQWKPRWHHPRWWQPMLNGWR
jgi:hypothetical protein